jgi:hypothetical protein
MGAWDRRRRRTIGGVTSRRVRDWRKLTRYGFITGGSLMACSGRNDQAGGRIAVMAGNNGYDIQMRYGSEV